MRLVLFFVGGRATRIVWELLLANGKDVIKKALKMIMKCLWDSAFRRLKYGLCVMWVGGPPMGQINYHESENHRKLLSFRAFLLALPSIGRKLGRSNYGILGWSRLEKGFWRGSSIKKLFTCNKINLFYYFQRDKSLNVSKSEKKLLLV